MRRCTGQPLRNWKAKATRSATYGCKTESVSASTPRSHRVSRQVAVFVAAIIPHEGSYSRVAARLHPKRRSSHDALFDTGTVLVHGAVVRSGSDVHVIVC